MKILFGTLFLAANFYFSAIDNMPGFIICGVIGGLLILSSFEQVEGQEI